MGAIAGIIYPELFPVTNAVQPALEILAARCSAEPHTYLFKNIELGSRGHPVGFDEHRCVVLLVDGEITNHPEIAEELRRAGFRTEGLSTSDLLVRAYEQWGSAFAERLEGVFAIALYDLRKRQLTLVRDPLGTKPLYWCFLNGSFIFASELKAILATGMVPQSPARDALCAYLYFGYIPQDMSPIENVNKLLPGHLLRYGEPGKVRVENYWSYSSRLRDNHPPTSPEERSHKLSELLGEAVAKEVARNGKLGYIATGSAGSACVGYYLSKSDHADSTEALTLQFGTQNQEEVVQARQVAERLGLGHRSLSLSPADLLKDLVRVVWQLDEPGADPAALAIWSLCKESRSSVNTLFSDVGSDEILATHARYPIDELQQPEAPIMTGWGRLLSNTALPLLSTLSTKHALRMMRWLRADPWYMEHATDQALFTPAQLQAMSPNLSRHFAPDIYLHRFHNLSHLGMAPSTYLYFDTRIVLADKLLLEHDRLTSPHGLKWWSPYIDSNVVDFMARMPDPEKLHPDESQRPVRRLLSDLMPGQEFVGSRSVSGFLTPWLNDEAVRQTLDYLQGGTLVEAGWLNPRWLRQALAGRSHPPVSFQQLWSLLTLEIWLRLYVNNPISLTPPDISVVDFLRRS